MAATQAYPIPVPSRNLHEIPDFPAPVWSYDRRIARVGKANKHHTTGWGTGRRRKVEYRMDRALTWFRGHVRGDGSVLDDSGRPIRLHEVLRLVNARDRAGWLQDHARLQLLIGTVLNHGPSSGWALPNPYYANVDRPTKTEYLLPRRSEPKARWWLRAMSEVRSVAVGVWERGARRRQEDRDRSLVAADHRDAVASPVSHPFLTVPENTEQTEVGGSWGSKPPAWLAQLVARVCQEHPAEAM